MFATTARAMASGFRPALAVIWGIVLGDIIFLLFAAFGLSMVARVMGNLFFLNRAAGSVMVAAGVTIAVRS